MKDNYDISLIIAIYNNYRWLSLIFAALENQTHKSFEVVLADDGSSEEEIDKTRELISGAQFNVQHIWHEDKGWRKDIILNKAVVAAKSDYLVFLDGDCIPNKHFIEDHYALREKNFVIGGRRVQLPQKISDTLSIEQVRKGWLENHTLQLLFSGERHSENAIRVANNKLRNIMLKPKKGYLLGCNFGIYKSDLLKVNGFDERFLSPATGEDTDLEARLLRIGIEVKRYKFICIVYHRKHKRTEIENDPNGVIFDYNNNNNISFTPYGIEKKSNENSN